ncbi:MAG: ATP-binding cassette domain-containing protein [Clostridia bacterium]|nr:ATP-binding cassette domain-containing protein [Clostridia bacterium]
MAVLEIKDLSFRYPEAEGMALNGASVSVNEGEFAVICGESGCGKTTLLRLIKKEIAPFGKISGEIIYNGESVEKLNKRISAGEIGFVLQDPESQIVTDFVWHELAFGLESLGLDSQTIRRRVAEMASYFGIADWFRKKTSELSGGQKQLLNLASVMAMQPKMLLLDEPTAQLDPIAASNFISTVKKLNRELGLTVVMIEHRLEEVFPIADRVILMDSGRVVFSESPRRIGEFFKENKRHAMLAGLPAAMRIFGLLSGEGEAPLTVGEGRRFVTEGYKNSVSSVEIAKTRSFGEAVVELKNVCFRYEKETPEVVRNAELSVYAGEHFCILGGNGTGKTTTLGIIAGVNKANRGKVLLFGKRIGSYSQSELYGSLVALLPQDPQDVFVANTVEDDLAEICRFSNIEKNEAGEKIKAVAEKLGISHLLKMHPYDLSGGERQKAALAKLLLKQPKILLLDEPTKGIDANAKLGFARIIRELCESGITVITVTHDVEFAAETADRCGLFFDGELISFGTPNEFFSENSFYTTAANRISRGHFKNAVLCSEVVELCLKNGKNTEGCDETD